MYQLGRQKWRKVSKRALNRRCSAGACLSLTIDWSALMHRTEVLGVWLLQFLLLFFLLLWRRYQYARLRDQSEFWIGGGWLVHWARTVGYLSRQGDTARSKIGWIFIFFDVAPLRRDCAFVDDRQAVCYKNFEPGFGVFDKTQDSHGISLVCDACWLNAQLSWL